MKINWDALGIAASLACAIHCALLPIVLTTLPLFGFNIIDNVAFEAVMIGVAFCVGVYAFYHGYKRHHHSFLPVGVFIVGFVFLVLKEIFHQSALLLLIPAVLSIITAHYMNYRYCQKAKHFHSTDHTH